MAATLAEDAAATFDPLRPRLIRIAYRMLGSVADAEDAVQDTFLRWLDADRDAVLEPEAYLRRVVTRLCLDQLKSARRRRETYIGPWMPEPLVEEGEDEVDDVTLPLMMALERLSPLERAAFLLHDVFGVGFEEIAETIGRDPAACRQLASRARSHVRAARPRFPLPKERGLEIAAAFFAASRSGDMGSCARSWRRTSRSPPMAAARGRRRSGRLLASTRSCASMPGLRALSPNGRRASCATVSSTACRDSSPSSRTARRRPRSKSKTTKAHGATRIV
jgi:RNA polymerase sigma factor (sigma-70 family)